MDDTAIIVTAYCGGAVENEQRKMTKSLCKSLYEKGHFVILASHSTIDLETQQYCHMFVYDSNNDFHVDGVPQSNRSHSVAELTSIHNALKLLPKRFKYVLKVCFDNSPKIDYADIIEKCKQTGKRCVTGRWVPMEITLGLNLMFFEPEFFQETLSLKELYRYDMVPNIEHAWFDSVVEKGLLDEVHREVYDLPPYFFGHNIQQYSHDGGQWVREYPYD